MMENVAVTAEAKDPIATTRAAEFDSTPANHAERRGVRLLFVVESGVDVRMLEGMAERFDLTVLLRPIAGGRAISQELSRDIRVLTGSAGRAPFAKWVRRQIRESRAATDVVLVQGYGLAALAANWSAWRAGLPSVMLVCSPVEDYYRCRKLNPHSTKRYRAIEITALRALARANAWLSGRYVVLSDYLGDVVRRHGRARSVDVVPVYGVDVERFAPSSTPKAELKARLGLPTTGTLVFFSSRIAPEKDSATLLKAVRRLRQAGKEVWLLNASGGHQELEQMARMHGAAPYLIARPAVDPRRELPSHYQACDICVQSSWAEGLGFSPLEALVCGAHVVAAHVGGLRETIVEGVTGWTYTAGDDVSLAERIAQVIADPAEASRRTLSGGAMVRERFETARAFDELSRTLTALCPKQAAARALERSHS